VKGIEHDARWAAVFARDCRADGTFVYAVVTTGVYCRPSCGARRANPKNVRFHDTWSDAERAGFRPCRRCRPDRPIAAGQTAAIVDCCRRLDARGDRPTLTELAARVGLSPGHFQRVFKRITGVTPAAYAAAARRARVREALAARGRTVTDAIYDAGFGSGGRFYEASGDLLGMTPTAYRAGGAFVTLRFAVGECSLGSVLVASSETGVCAILLGDDPDALLRDLEDRFPRATLVGGDAAFERTVGRVVALIEAPKAGHDLPLDLRGTLFQQRVWQALRGIPSGSTISYAELARRIGAPSAVRAVARACGANPLAVAIPCHRVVRTGGALSGYRWGVERKRTLLAREGESSAPDPGS
jgi:AraC family transcriptional regulator of adaptative response/methylated-DNA-[protein]-cysteine methyltransferase